MFKRHLIMLLAATFMAGSGISGCAAEKKSSQAIVKADTKKKIKRTKRTKRRSYRRNKRRSVDNGTAFGYKQGDKKLLQRGRNARFGSSLDSW